MQEEPQIKKRKLQQSLESEGENKRELQQILYSKDILFEISKYFNTKKDYFNLALINKNIYNLMINENLYSLNRLFKNIRVTLSSDGIPKYIFDNLNNLQIINSYNLHLLKKFTNLKYLSINNCNINDYVLQNLKNLEKLNIENCKNITGTCFNYLTQLTSLRIIKNNILDDDHLINLKNLKKLYLKKCNNLNGTFLQKFNQLESLTLKNCNYIKPKYLSYLNSDTLKKLYVSDEHEVEGEYIRNLRNLESLTINSGDIGDEDFENLQNLMELNLKVFSDCFTGKCFNLLINLEILSIDSFLLDDFDLSCLLNLKELTILNDELGIDVSEMTNLRKLKLKLVDNYTEESLSKLNNITSLNVKKGFFTGKCLNNYLQLTELNASYTDIEEQYLFDLKNLKKLKLQNCEGITGECLLFLNNLTNLNINKTEVNEEYLINLPKLKKLKMANCPNIVFGDFLLQMDNLQCLVYDGNVRATEENIFFIKSLIEEGVVLMFAFNEVCGYELESVSMETVKEMFDLIRNRERKERQKIIEEKDNEIKRLQLLVEQLQKK
ncbi:hypothetical protein ABK040_007718 [Willaertia magna]